MGGLSYRLQVLEASEFHRSSRKEEVGPGQPGLYLPETLTASQVRNHLLLSKSLIQSTLLPRLAQHLRSPLRTSVLLTSLPPALPPASCQSLILIQPLARVRLSIVPCHP